jgi:hypothetical protein
MPAAAATARGSAARAMRPPAVTRPGAWFVDLAAEPVGVLAAGHHEIDQG